ncbi:MAG: NAD-dependent epimerase/dehydratase family protein [Calditrichaeota bacterium]|nr:MAG: NAD-dependent epimerase/dehydratase family protein [Calditrichota bacterium]
MRILVTGGAGFIGKHLVKRLLDEKHTVWVVDNFVRARRNALDEWEHDGALHVMEGDIRAYETFRKLPGGFDAVYHLAAQSNVMGAVQDLDFSFQTNVIGTYNVLKYARESRASRFIFASSRESYGEARYIPVDEGHPLESKNAYGASKVCGERYCDVFRNTYGMNIFVSRLANVYGPGDKDRVIPIFAGKAAENAPMTIYGGKQVIDFISVEVVVNIYMEMLTHAPVYEPVNIGSGKGTTLFELVEAIRRITGTRSELIVEAPREVEVVRFVADIKRLRKTFQTDIPENPLYLLPETLNSTVNGSNK